MMLVSILLCLGVGTIAQESVSPWQTLNQAMSDTSKPEPVVEQDYDAAAYEVQYPEANYQNDSETPITQEELIIQSLPFKIPFKMDKKQMALTIKLLKAAIKPVLKSKELSDFVAYIEDGLSTYKADLETQMYVTLLLDSAQEIYEGKETTELNMMAKRIFTDMSDEETARTMGSLFRSYLGPAVSNYIIDPMRSYVIQPVRSYLYDPVSNYITDFAERIGTWMESSQRPYIDVQYPENYYRRWSERVNDYANRISNWASQARQGLEMARRMLELQDEARCHGCGDHDEHDYENFDIYNVKVQDLAWLAWLSALAFIALLAPAIAIPLGVGIPLGIAGGPTGLPPPPPPTDFVAVQVPILNGPAPAPIGGTGAFATAPAFGTGFDAFPLAAAPGDFVAAAPGAFAAAPGAFAAAPGAFAASDSFPIRRRQTYSPYEHIEKRAAAFDYSVLKESNMQLKFSDKDAYEPHYTRYSEKDE